MRLFQAALDTPLDSPFSATLSVHGLHFTVWAPSNLWVRKIPQNFRQISLSKIKKKYQRAFEGAQGEHCRHLASRRHRILIPVATQMSLPLVYLSLFKDAQDYLESANVKFDSEHRSVHNSVHTLRASFSCLLVGRGPQTLNCQGSGVSLRILDLSWRNICL